MTFDELEPGDLFQWVPSNGEPIPDSAPVWVKVLGNCCHVFGRLREQIIREGLLHVGAPEKANVVKLFNL